MTKAFYVTTPIYYANSEPHVGTAYTSIVADVLARYHRLRGEEVFFLTGTDEHGQKIFRAAKEQGLTPKALADQLCPKFKELTPTLSLTNDHFIRTTDPAHEHAVKTLFSRLIASGDVYKGQYKGWYCTGCEGYVDAPADAKPTCELHGAVDWLEEENYFFRLSKYRDRILAHFKANPGFVEPTSRYNEVLNRIKGGLEDVSVSRSSFDWGVPLPGDEKHVIWVWFDALINYISGVGFPDDPERFARHWPADVHLVGKDIIWFHSVIWPCMLIAAGIEPPRKVYAHGWWTVNGDKISKTKGNVVYPRDVTAKYGVDPLRYFMLRELPFGLDGDFSLTAFTRRYNSDLGNDLGNLVNRVLALVEKHFGGVVPEQGAYEPVDAALRATFEAVVPRYEETLGRYEFSLTLEEIWKAVRHANAYVDQTKPWTLAKDPANRGRLGTVLGALCEGLRELSCLLAPFLPNVSEGIRRQIGAEGPVRLPGDLAWGGLAAGTRIAKGAPLFPRVDAP
ncbi:MAG: methionine--tRNA ligase [Planctomycetota bacterium]